MAPLRIIGSGPHRNAVARPAAVAPTQGLGDEPDLTWPPLHRHIDGQVHVDAVALRPALQFLVEQEVTAGPGTGDQCYPAERSRSANAPSTTGRSGASPTPPATMTRSRPAASANPQFVPNGPRIPITLPA